MKGAGVKEKHNQIKEVTWNHIAACLNKQFKNERSIDNGSKKYDNMKQRAKDKIDLIRRHKTGGRPPSAPLTSAEEVLLQAFDGRPNIVGLSGCIDSDGIDRKLDNQRIDDVLIDGRMKACGDCGSSIKVSQPQRSRRPCNKRNVRTELEEAEIKNLQLENEKMKEEIEKIKIEKRKLEIEIDYIETKKAYIVCKLNAQFPENLLDKHTGYRFKVYAVKNCPMNKEAFEKAAKNMNCPGRYLCAPNKNLTTLLEFCTDRPKTLFAGGNCVRLEGTGDLNNYNCSGFDKGCPTTYYVDEEIYNYPACLNINPNFRCFVADKACAIRPATSNTDKMKKEVFVVIKYIVVLILLLVIGLIFYQRSTNLCNLCKAKDELDEVDQKDLQEFLKRGHLNIHHARCIIVGCAGAGKTTLLKRLEGATLEELRDIKETELLDVHVNDFQVIEKKRKQKTNKTIKQNKNVNDIKESKMKQTITFSKNEMKQERESPNKEEAHFREHEDTETLSLIDDGESSMKAEVALEKDCQNRADNLGVDIKEMKPIKSDDGVKIDFQMNAVCFQGDNSERKTKTSEASDVEWALPRERIHMEETAGQLSVDNFEFLTKKGENSRITFLDFAGQDIYYAFHQIYLTPKAAYILVLDMKKQFNEKELTNPKNDLTLFEAWTYKDYYTFWVKSIDSFSDIKSPVIVVGTHGDKIPQKDHDTFFVNFEKLFADRPDLRRHIHSKRCFKIGFPLKGSKLEDLHEIKDCIASVVESVPYWEEEIPPKWAIFEQLLEKRIKNKILSREKLSDYNAKLNPEFQLPEDEITDVLKYLNRVGSILYSEDENVRNTIILDVQWFVDAFKCIITDSVDIGQPSDIDRKNFHDTGELEDKQLKAIWGKNADRGYLKHKQEIISFMENLGLLAVCESNKSSSNDKNPDWYYFPSLNRRRFNKEQDTPKDFKPSSILCFQFDDQGQLPLFVFYALVSKCNKINGWSILVEDKKHCIYDKSVYFSYKAAIVIVCICKFQIQVQVFFQPNSIDENNDKIKVEIQTSLERKLRQFKRYTYEIGYKCQNGELLAERDNSFIALESFPTTDLLCSQCAISRKHIVDNSICWIKRSRTENADTHLEFENSKEITDEGLVSLIHIFRDSLQGNIENFKFHLKQEMGSRKNLQKIVTKKGWNLMHCAAKGGNSKIFEIITNELNDFQMKNKKTYDQMTVLHIASRYGRYNICKRILDEEDSKDFIDETATQGKNACHFAAEGGSIDVLELLNENGANAKATTDNGQNIFHIACIYSQLEMCRYISTVGKFRKLLSAESTDGWNAVLHAAKNGDTAILRFLWEKNVSFLHISESKRNALHVACDNGNLDACKVIADLCPSLPKSVDMKGRHAGHFAARSGNLDILKHLETKMNVAIDAGDGMNILHMACLHGHLEICRYILQKYPYLNVKKTGKGLTTVHFVAVRGNNTGCEIEIFKALLNCVKQADIKQLTEKGNSVLTLAIKYNDHDFAEFLLKHYPELLNIYIPNVNDPRTTGNDDPKMKSILDKFLHVP